MNVSSIIRYDHMILYAWRKILLNLQDFIIEVTFIHIIIFLKSFMTPSKIRTVISFYAKALKCFPENIFTDIMNLVFTAQFTFSQNFGNNWNKNVNFRQIFKMNIIYIIYNENSFLQIILTIWVFSHIDSWGLCGFSANPSK